MGRRGGVVTPAHDLIVDAVRAGVLLIAEGDRLRFKAVHLMPPELAGRLKVHKAELLAILRGGSLETDHRPTTGSVTPIAVYTAQERRLLAGVGVKPGDVPMMDRVKGVFPSAEVIDARCAHRNKPRTPRQRATGLIRQARRSNDPDLAVAQRDGWHERLAICTIDGGLSLDAAERIAIAELTDD